MRGTTLAVALFLVLAGCTEKTEPVQDEDLGITEETGAIVGVVVDDAIRPLAGVLVTGDGLETHTDEEGAFRFPGLAPGIYLLDVHLLGYEDVQTTAEVVAGQKDPPVVKVLLKPDPAGMPFHAVKKFVGFVECGTSVIALCAVPPYVAYDVACLQLDVCGLPNGTNDRFIEYAWLDSTPMHAQAEMFWDSTQALGEEMTMILTWATKEDQESGFISGNFNRTRGASPIMATANATQIAEAGIGTESYWIERVFAGNVAINQEFEIVTHFFHGYVPPADWRFSEQPEAPPPR